MLVITISLFVVTFVIADVAIKRPENLISALGMCVFVLVFYVFSYSPSQVSVTCVYIYICPRFLCDVFSIVCLRAFVLACACVCLRVHVCERWFVLACTCVCMCVNAGLF